ncbi:MAG: protein kinase [Alphaproteobacteria bacterium]|nr:protein kinase [Alphaproteobacteria bacterium]
MTAPPPDPPSSDPSPEDTDLSPLEASVLLTDISGAAAIPPQAPAPAVFGRYELLGVLGRGGMGVVMHARDPRLDREVALKLLHHAGEASDRQRRRFLREARAVAKLEHPNIVDIYDIGDQDGVLYFTMQLVLGPTLRDRIEEGPMPPERALPIAISVARALQHAHDQGLIHRDVKPGNVLLDGDTPMLTDFGLVKDLEGASVNLTREAAVMGTPAYMSPEQAYGDQDNVGPLSDVYALGVVLYEMLAGEQPFRAPTPERTMQRVVSHTPGPLTDPALDRICRKAMARHPQDRYASAAELAEDLQRYLDGQQVQATDLPLSRRLALVAEDNRSALRGAGAASLLAALLVLLAVGVRGALQRSALHQREVAAMERLAVMEARVAELDALDRDAQAEETFDAFVHFDEHTGTRALALAWLHRGLATEDPEEAEVALATAYALAEQPRDQIEALRGLAERFRAALLWDRLDAVVRTLEARGAQDLRPWQVPLAARTGDLAAAARLGRGTDDAAMLAQLARATPTPHAADWALRWDLDLDGQAELVLWEGSRGTLTPLRTDPGPSLATAGPALTLPLEDDRAALPDWGTLFPPVPLSARGGAARAIDEYDNHCRALALEGGALQVGRLRPCEVVNASAQADTDGDGQVEDYVAVYRELLRVEPDGGLTEVYPPTRLAVTEIADLAVVDVDGDGRDELLASQRGWRMYDLRLLAADEDGHLRLRARRRLGELDSTAIVDLGEGLSVATFQTHDTRTPINRITWRADEPQGALEGVHVLGLGPEGFTPQAVIPLPGVERIERGRPGWKNREAQAAMFAADLDGDGVDEIIAGRSYTWTFILRLQPDGTWTALPLDGWSPIAVQDLDHDGDDELVLHAADPTDAVWVIGVGEETLPRRAAPQTAPDAPPEGLSPALRAAWIRAEELVGMGLPEVAAERLTVLADLSTDTLPARLRAAQILEGAGLYDAAHARYLEASSQPPIATQAWEGAERTAQAAQRLPAALVAGRQRLSLPDPPPGLRRRVTLLERWAAAPEVRVSLAQGFDPRLQVLSPLDLGWSARAGGLRIRLSGPTPVLRLPLTWSGDYTRVSVTLTPHQVSWGASWNLNLTPPGAPHPQDAVTLGVQGGGGVYNVVASCPWRGESLLVPLEQIALDEPVTVTVDLRPDTWTLSCALEQRGEELVRRTFVTEPPAWGDGAVDLLLTGSSLNIPIDGVLHDIELIGFTLRDEPPSPLARANAALARGDVDGALALLEGPVSGDPVSWAVSHALALEAAGRLDEAERVLGDALARAPDLNGLLPALLTLRLDGLESPLRHLLGPRFLWEVGSAWSLAAGVNEDSPWATEPLTEHLNGLEALPWARLAPADRLVALETLARRGAAWRRRGRLAAAERDLAQAWSLAEAWRETADPPMDTALRQLLTYTARERALTHIERRDPDAAMEALLEGLAVSPAPTFYADALAARGDLDALHGHALWRQVEAARQLGP